MTRSGWVGIGTWTFATRAVAPAATPTTVVVNGQTWNLIYYNASNAVVTSWALATTVEVVIAYTSTITTSVVSCSNPGRLTMAAALSAILSPASSFTYAAYCSTGNPVNAAGNPGVIRGYNKG